MDGMMGCKACGAVFQLENNENEIKTRMRAIRFDLAYSNCFDCLSVEVVEAAGI